MEALKRINWHKDRGHRIIIISASPKEFLIPIANKLEIELISTETSTIDEYFIDNYFALKSINCKGEEKVKRLEKFIDKKIDDIELHAYGDSKGDYEILKAADYPHWRNFKEETSNPPIK